MKILNQPIMWAAQCIKTYTCRSWASVTLHMLMTLYYGGEQKSISECMICLTLRQQQRSCHTLFEMLQTSRESKPVLPFYSNISHKREVSVFKKHISMNVLGFFFAPFTVNSRDCLRVEIGLSNESSCFWNTHTSLPATTQPHNQSHRNHVSVFCEH